MFFKKKNYKDNDNNLIKVAALLIHAAKLMKFTQIMRKKLLKKPS